MLHLLPIGLWLLCIKLSKGTSNPYGNRGGGSDPEPPKAPSPQETTQDVLEAHLATDPQMAQSAYDIATNPQYGASAWTKMYEDIRRQQYPEETNVRDQLTQNVLQNLVSPTGISPEQQSALDARRGEAYGDVQTGVREAANLGGKLYGGQRIDKEVEARTDLSNLFATEDINRDERSRLNAIQAAIPLLQLLYPGSQVTPPQFQSAAPSGDTAFSGATSAYGSQLGYQAAQQQAQANMMGSLFQGLGGGAGGVAGGIGAAAACWVAAEIYDGWEDDRTHAVRFYILNIAPAWFRNFYIKYGERIAKFIHNKPYLKAILKPLFDYFVSQTRCSQLVLGG